MRVPMLDLTRRSPEEIAALREAFDRVLASGRFILGDEVEALERAAADRLGLAHAIGVSSGTDALVASLMALDIGPGDEVICPAFSFVATATSIIRVGATPVLVDVEDETLNIDPRAMEAAIGPRTAAIMPVHLFGLASAKIAPRGVDVIEDAAQAFGAAGVGAGRIACFSCFPSKNLAALGDAGIVATNDEGLATLVRAIRRHGASEKHRYERIGGNFRMDALQAALLRVEIGLVDERTRRRHEHARAYADALEGLPIRLPRADAEHTFHQYVLRTRDRDALRGHLAARGVETEIYYPRALHEQPCLASFSRGPLPIAERAAREVLALPIFAELTSAEIDYVAASIRAFFRA